MIVVAGAGGHAEPSIDPPDQWGKGFDKIVLSGCLTTGNDITGALRWGRYGLYGYPLYQCQESMADEAYQKMIMDSGAEDIVYTAAVSGLMPIFYAQPRGHGHHRRHGKKLKKSILERNRMQ